MDLKNTAAPSTPSSDQNKKNVLTEIAGIGSKYTTYVTEYAPNREEKTFKPHRMTDPGTKDVATKLELSSYWHLSYGFGANILWHFLEKDEKKQVCDTAVAHVASLTEVVDSHLSALSLQKSVIIASLQEQNGSFLSKLAHSFCETFPALDFRKTVLTAENQEIKLLIDNRTFQQLEDISGHEKFLKKDLMTIQNDSAKFVATMQSETPPPKTEGLAKFSLGDKQELREAVIAKILPGLHSHAHIDRSAALPVAIPVPTETTPSITVAIAIPIDEKKASLSADSTERLSAKPHQQKRV